LINIVCDNSLLTGYAADQKVIGKGIVREVINHLDGVSLEKKRGKFAPLKVILIVVLGLVVFVILGTLMNTKWATTGWIQFFKDTILKFYQEIFGKLLR